MKKPKKRKERRPEDDKNNVAYYKRTKEDHTTRLSNELTDEEVKPQPEKSKLWSQIVKTYPTPSYPEKSQTIKINYESRLLLADWVRGGQISGLVRYLGGHCFNLSENLVNRQ